VVLVLGPDEDVAPGHALEIRQLLPDFGELTLIEGMPSERINEFNSSNSPRRVALVKASRIEGRARGFTNLQLALL
jgi:hypothetical protein